MRIWTRIILLALAIALSCGLFYYYPWRSTIRLHGVVLDAATKLPVPNARVIIEFVAWRVMDEEHMGYGFVTDQKGEFSLNVRAPQKYTWLYVAASAPNDDFGVSKVLGDDVVVYTSRIPAKRAGEPWLRYRGLNKGSEQFGKMF